MHFITHVYDSTLKGDIGIAALKLIISEADTSYELFN